MNSKSPGTGQVPQVQIRLLGTDGEWREPASQATAVLAALRAADVDIRECSGSYSPDQLREIREAASKLSATAAQG
jgi:hypothetical protein